MFMGFVRLFLVFGSLGLIISWIYKLSNHNSKIKKRKILDDAHNAAVKSKSNAPKAYTTRIDSMNIATTDFKVAGVTFKDGRYSRQAALRKIKFQDPPMDGPIDFEFEDYEYDGKPAILIKANERIIGNVPANLVNEFIELRDSCSSMELQYKVSGGGDFPFGCRMIITWRF